MPAANVGDEVTVTFKGTVKRIEVTGSLSSCMIIRSEDSGYTHAIYQGAYVDVTVTKPVGPDNWPAKENDVWKAGSEVYHVIGGNMIRTRTGSVYTISRTPAQLLESGVKLELLYRSL